MVVFAVDRKEALFVYNQIILYTMDDSKQIVYVAHIYYDGRNYIDDLM